MARGTGQVLLYCASNHQGINVEPGRTIQDLLNDVNVRNILNPPNNPMVNVNGQIKNYDYVTEPGDLVEFIKPATTKGY